MWRAQVIKRIGILSVVFAVLMAGPVCAFAQDDPQPTHGGYGALAGGVGFAAFGAGATMLARAIYADPLNVDCTAEPNRCRRTAGEHILVGLVGVTGAAGVYASGFVGQKLTEKWDWNPALGWSLAGAYLGLPTTLLLQNAIPEWTPDWSRDLVGVTIGAAGSVGSAYAFRAIARRRGHAWPEFGFGAGGLGLGLTIGTLVAPNTVWVPILGGLGSLLGASTAALVFP